MKNPTFVQESAAAMRSILSLSRDYWAEGHSELRQNNFDEAKRLLTTAKNCIERGIQIHAELVKETKHHQCEHIRVLYDFIQREVLSDLAIIEMARAVYERGSSAPAVPVMH